MNEKERYERLHGQIPLTVIPILKDNGRRLNNLVWLHVLVMLEVAIATSIICAVALLT